MFKSKSKPMMLDVTRLLQDSSLMSMEQKGSFLTMLCIQHQNGFITQDQMKSICIAYGEHMQSICIAYGDVWMYEPLLESMQKQSEYSMNRKRNATSKKKPLVIPSSNSTSSDEAYGEHMVSICETDALHTNINNSINSNSINSINNNINIIKTKKNKKQGKPESVLQVLEYFSTIDGTESDANEFYDYYSSNGWKVGRTPMVDWLSSARNWMRRKSTYKNQNQNQKANESTTSKNGRFTITDAERILQQANDIASQQNH
jgi:hypothetical protein